MDTLASAVGRTEPFDHVVLGISMLVSVAKEGAFIGTHARFAVPDNLLRLVERVGEGSDRHAVFLAKVLSRYDRRRFEFEEEQELGRWIARRLDVVFARLRERNALVEIAEEDIDEQIASLLADSFISRRNEIDLSPSNNFLREYYLRALSWSRRQIALVAERGRQIFNYLGHYIASLQLPDRHDRMMVKKREFADEVLGLQEYRTAKFYAGVVAGSLSFVHPVFGVVGLVIVFTDP